MWPTMTAEPTWPGGGLPVYQPATDVLAGTCMVPRAVRPSLIRRVWTPMTGMDRYTGRLTLVTVAGRGGHHPGRRPVRARGRPRADPVVAGHQQQAAHAAPHGEQAGAEQRRCHR